jgi:RNA polymerase sigma-70 factor (ECF subfamily)
MQQQSWRTTPSAHAAPGANLLGQPGHSDGASMSDQPGSHVHSQALETYVQELTACQSRLRGYILASLGNYADAADVLQRTNLVLWKKAGEFHTGANFLPWALTFARYEVLSFLRDAQRDRHVFSNDVAEMMLDLATVDANDPNDRHLALRKCLEKVPRRSRDLLWQRYGAEKSIRQIAVDSQRSEDAVKSLFLRIRRSLERCVEAGLKWNIE